MSTKLIVIFKELPTNFLFKGCESPVDVGLLWQGDDTGSSPNVYI